MPEIKVQFTWFERWRLGRMWWFGHVECWK